MRNVGPRYVTKTFHPEKVRGRCNLHTRSVGIPQQQDRSRARRDVAQTEPLLLCNHLPAAFIGYQYQYSLSDLSAPEARHAKGREPRCHLPRLVQLTHRGME